MRRSAPECTASRAAPGPPRSKFSDRVWSQAQDRDASFHPRWRLTRRGLLKRGGALSAALNSVPGLKQRSHDARGRWPPRACPHAESVPRDRPRRQAGTANGAMTFGHIRRARLTGETTQLDNRSARPCSQGWRRSHEREPMADLRTACPAERPTNTDRGHPIGTVSCVMTELTTHRATAGASPRLERHPPADRRRQDGWLRRVGQLDRADGHWTDEVAAARVLARADLLLGQPLVLLGALPDLSQPPLPDGRHGLRRHRDRHVDPREPAAPPTARSSIVCTPTGSAGPTTSPISHRRESSPRSSSRIRRIWRRSRSSWPTAPPDRSRRSASSTPSSACCPTSARRLRRSPRWRPIPSWRRSSRTPTVWAATRRARRTCTTAKRGPTRSSRPSWTRPPGRARCSSTPTTSTAATTTTCPLRRRSRPIRSRRIYRPATPRRIQPLRPARPRHRRLALLQAERGHQCAPRPHLGAGDD